MERIKFKDLTDDVVIDLGALGDKMKEELSKNGVAYMQVMCDQTGELKEIEISQLDFVLRAGGTDYREGNGEDYNDYMNDASYQAVKADGMNYCSMIGIGDGTEQSSETPTITLQKEEA